MMTSPFDPGCLRAICFDLDDTLWDFVPVIARAERTLRAFFEARQPALLELMHADWMKATRARIEQRFPDKRHDFTFLRKQGLLELVREAGHPETLAEEAWAAFYAARNQLTPFADVLPALTRLGRRFRLATMSNGNADLAAIGLAKFFETSLCAGEIGALKPAPVTYLRLLEKLGLPPDRVAYVGDDPVLDVEGPRSVGMHAIWLDRTGTPWPEALLPPAQRVTSLTELADLLGAPTLGC